MGRPASVSPPSYVDLRAEGLALRTRLRRLDPAGGEVAELIGDVRLWQRRAAWAVVSRNPHQAADFHANAGASEPPIGPWPPSSGWRPRLDRAISAWLGAIDGLARWSAPVAPDHQLALGAS